MLVKWIINIMLIDHMWLNYIYAFTVVLQRTHRCPLFLLQPNEGDLQSQQQAPLVYRFSPDAQDYFHDVEDKWKKGVAEKAEAIIIESGHKVDSDDERKKVY